MNDVPHNDDSSDDIDDIYRRAAAHDPSRPSPRVRQAVLQQAAQRAAERTLERPSLPQKAKKFFPPRRAALLGTLAAAVLAGLVIAPQFLLTPPQPARLKRPVEITQIEAPRPPPLQAESVHSSTPPPAASFAPATSSPPPPATESSSPKGAMNASASQERSKAAAKTGVEQDSAPQVNHSEPTRATAPKLAEAPARAPIVASTTALASASTSAPPAAVPAPPSPSAGASTMVNALSADVAVQGYVPRDETYIVTEAPDSPVVGAAVRRAAEQGDIARLQFLLDRGADINARDADSRSPLMLAVTHSRTKVVQLLLAHGADANAADRSGTTPLQAAVSTHQTAMAATLRAAGAH